nr:TetR/AcrR family transcriptional regulator [Actinomycetales bacterium]
MRNTDSEAAQSIRHQSLSLFGEGGYTGTSLRQIALAAGCDVALIPYYFGSKPELFIEVVGTASQSTRAMVRDGFKRVIADGDDPTTAMESLVGFLDAWTQGEGQLGMRALLMTAAASSAVPEKVQEFASSELQSLVDEIVQFEGFWEETRFGLTIFVALVIGTEILTHFVGFEPLTRVGREELARAQVSELRDSLERLWAESEPAPEPPSRNTSRSRDPLQPPGA